MHKNEIWQQYNHNGVAIVGKGYPPSEFKEHPEAVMANSHIWFWKKSYNEMPEILLQKRSMTELSMPGMYHISAGGHINVGETPVEAAARETTEEMGIKLNIEELYYVGSMRLLIINPNSIANIFLYELSGAEEFVYVDGEVDSVEWRTLEDFKLIAQNPEANNLVDQGQEYFNLLIQSLEHIAASNK